VLILINTPVCAAHLLELVQLGDVSHAGEAHVDEAEQLQVGELFCDSFNLPFSGATVVQHQLLDLRRSFIVTQ